MDLPSSEVTQVAALVIQEKLQVSRDDFALSTAVALLDEGVRVSVLVKQSCNKSCDPVGC